MKGRGGGMVDAQDSKSCEGNLMRVRVSLPAQAKPTDQEI
jgi:hypothetical protein